MKKQKKAVRYLPDEKVMEFAQDVIANRYFFSTQIHESQLKTLIHLVFMPLAFLDKKSLNKMKKDDVVVFYEEHSAHVGGRSINGYPFFGSVRMLTRADWDAVREAVNSLQEAISKVKKDREEALAHDKKTRRKDKGNKGPPKKVGKGGKEVPGPQEA